MKIMHVIAPGPAGGAESAVRSLALGIRNAGHDVEVAALTGDTIGEHPFVESLRADGIMVTDVRCGRRDYVGEGETLARMLFARRVDVVHSHVYRADAAAFLASNFTSTPHVSTLHGYTSGGFKNAVYVKFDTWIMRRCAAVICVSADLRDEAIANGIDHKRIYMVPNGYSASPFVRDVARMSLNIASDARVVGWVGRLSPEKGPDLMLNAVAQLGTPDVQVVVIGDGPERPKLETHARHLGLEGRVRFAGPIADAGRLVSAFDVLALSSRKEGSPMVVLEAMAASVPIVAFGVGGVTSMLSPETGLVVAPGDVGGMARAIDYTFACPRSATTRSRAARAAFDRWYNADTCAKRTLDIYERILVNRAPCGSRVVVVPAKRSQPRPQAASTYKRAEM